MSAPTGQILSIKGKWSTAEAKAKLPELIEREDSEGPRLIKRNGRPRAMVVSLEAWERHQSRGTLYWLLRSASDDFGTIDLDRPQGAKRGDVF
jgi:prevent-host-death family protein